MQLMINVLKIDKNCQLCLLLAFDCAIQWGGEGEVRGASSLF